MMLLAVACSGGDTATDTATADTAAEDVADAVATTAPILSEDPEVVPTVDSTVFEPPEEPTEVPVDPYETIVLNVKDSVDPLQTIPVFSSPTGLLEDEIQLMDYNPFEDVSQLYPLYATTQFGNRLSLVVEEYDPSGNFALVYMPVRPNGTTAWVQTAFFDENRHDYRVEISLSGNEVRVFKGEELLRTSETVAGREDRPTPVVRSYIDEKIPGTQVGPAYGDWVLSIAAFSESLGSFAGGMPKLALHGTNQPELMGQNVSSGCVRIPNEVVSYIADTVPVGTPVDIIA